MTRKIFKTVVWIFVFICITFVTLPVMIYWYGLSIIDGKPKIKENFSISEEEKDKIWIKHGGIGVPELKSLTPWHYYMIILCEIHSSNLSVSEILSCQQKYPGFSHAHLASRIYVQKKRRFKGMLKWYISTTALSFWITRNMDIDEVIRYIYQQNIKELKNKTVKNFMLRFRSNEKVEIN